jgi:hypothetical protein
MLRRIDLGNSQAKTNGGIGRRAAPLCENFFRLRTRKAHDVMDGEEIGREFALRDQREFFAESLDDLFRNS